MGEDTKSGTSRRDLLGGMGGFAAMALAAKAWAGPSDNSTESLAVGPSATPGVGSGGDRTRRAFQVRVQAAELARDTPPAPNVSNGDEEALPGRIACFSKSLPHDRLGQVDPGSYELLLAALSSGAPRDFELIPIGGKVKLANPQGAIAFNLVGPDAAQPALEPAPRFASAEQAGELVELYWQALARDVLFERYETDPVTLEAAADLGKLSAFTGPRESGAVTPRTLFRGNTAGDLVGPYVSQFLWKDIFFTPIRVEQRLRTAVAGLDYLTDYQGWLQSQNGTIAGVNRFDERPRYIRNGRDLGEYVHRDFTYQAPLSACLILLKMGALPDGANPYKHSRTQSGFATFGPPALLSLLASVTQAALSACWYQKWLVHRRLRPEEMGGRVEIHRQGKARYPLHADLLDSAAMAATLRRRGNALLPAAYPEGCPTHPSYPAGHAAIAGACSTVLKAFFDESYVLPEPVVASPDGLSLQPWRGAPLTLGNELDKLASNIAHGRNFAGVHWRADSDAGIRLGERVALAMLREMKLTGNELFEGFSLRTFGGEHLTI